MTELEKREMSRLQTMFDQFNEKGSWFSIMPP